MANLTSFVFISILTGSVANTPIPKPACDSSKEVSVRFASSSNRVYVESVDGTRGGCSSLTHIYETLGTDKSPVFPLETPGEWYLGSELYVLDGITLEVHGTSAGGDCDYLKMKSDSTGHVYVRAHGGSLDILSTEVSSWDAPNGSVDTNYDDGRAYLSAISEVLADTSETCKGIAKNTLGEARMDIEDSTVSYLGYSAAESWGISWKLRGLCNDNSNEKSYEGIAVYGDIRNSDISNLYYGHYSYGAANSVITGNKFYDHVGYCIDPHNRSSNLTVTNNEMYGCGDHGAIFSKWCRDVIIKDNYIHDNDGVGIFPHYLSDRAVITGNVVEGNSDSGIAFLESSGGVVSGNTVRRNVHGIRFSVGSRNNVVLDNIFEDNTGYDVYTYPGSDSVVEQPDNSLVNNIFFRNTFSGNNQGFRFDESVSSQFVENDVLDAETFEVNDSETMLLVGNDFPEAMNFDLTGSCLEMSSEDPCGDESLNVFTSSDADRVLEGVGGVISTPSGTPSPVSDITASPTMLRDTNAPTASPSSSNAFTSQPTVATDRGMFIDSMGSDVPTGSPTGAPTGAPTGSPTGSSTLDPGLVSVVDELVEDSAVSGATKVGQLVSTSLMIAAFVSIVLNILS